MPTASTGFIENCVTGISESLALQMGIRSVRGDPLDDDACGMDAGIADGAFQFAGHVNKTRRLLHRFHNSSLDHDLFQGLYPR